jgi:hypothetical protein
MSKRREAGLAGRRATWFRITAAASSAAMLSVLGLAGTSMAATGGAVKAAAPAAAATLAGKSASSCHLGHGVKHVVELTFDNVHYFRDNPNVPSDLEMMPNLLNFFENNGTFLSNNHTPLIAHTADDILTTYTGLYGDRQGVGIANDYQAYNTDGPNGSFNTTDSASGFTYWTGKINDTATTPSPDRDVNPNMVYSPVPPATARPAVAPNTVTPAPWVPFTRAGCNVGDVATANQELENVQPDIANTFGPSSPEEAQLQAELPTDSFADNTTADYVGIAVHCAQGNAFCTTAKAVRGNQTTVSPTAQPDLLPQEPGGYNGFEALFGHRYVAPQLSDNGQANLLNSNGFRITDSNGNLVDLNGNTMTGPFTSPPRPGFPGFSNINAAQSLAYMADMLETGVPVVNGYISDIHGNEKISSLTAPGEPCFHAPAALGSGSACYIAQAPYYNAAFGTFFQRLAADGITAANTEFILSSDEGDHEAGANVGRAIQPTPANCDGATVSGDTVTPDVLCTYPAGSFGELGGNITGLLATQKHDTTPFSLESDTAPEFYVTGNPAAASPTVRNLERDVAGLTAFNPYTNTTQPITNFIADPTEEAILHFVNADPARTPTFALFGKPDYFWQDLGTTCPPPTGAPSCVAQNTGFAWDHGAYAAEINTNYVGFAGPGVKNIGLDGQAPNTGPNSAGPNSGQGVVADSGTTGTWVDETDIRPTLMYLTGLKDDYIQDGRVISEILANPNSALSAPGVESLGACYKQLNSSVGLFGDSTLRASTAAVESNTPGDGTFKSTNAKLSALEKQRDMLAITIKDDLNSAAFGNQAINGVNGLTAHCGAIIAQAGNLAQRA